MNAAEWITVAAIVFLYPMKLQEWLIVAVAVWLIWAGLGGGGIVPSPPPIPGDGLRMLILEETADRGKLPRPQAAILTSTKVREYLKAKSGEMRQLDDDQTAEETAFMSANWKAAYERAKADSKGVTPWVILSNGRTGESRPLPASEDELLTLLKSYGGA